MFVLNKYQFCNKKYVVTLGADKFCVYADSENEAIEIIAAHFVAHNNSEWYFDAIEVDVMAASASKTIADFIEDTGLRYCPKHKIYLPKCRVEEVSI